MVPAAFCGEVMVVCYCKLYLFLLCLFQSYLVFLRTIGDLAECFECDSINIKVGVIGWGLGIIGLVVSFLSYGLFGKIGLTIYCGLN